MRSEGQGQRRKSEKRSFELDIHRIFLPLKVSKTAAWLSRFYGKRKNHANFRDLSSIYDRIIEKS